MVACFVKHLALVRKMARTVFALYGDFVYDVLGVFIYTAAFFL